MAEQLRDLGRLKDELLDVACSHQLQSSRHEHHISITLTELIRSQRLHDLRHKEEYQPDRVLFQHTHGILQDQWVIAVSRLKVGQRRHGRDRTPDREPLIGLAHLPLSRRQQRDDAKIRVNGLPSRPRGRRGRRDLLSDIAPPLARQALSAAPT